MSIPAERITECWQRHRAAFVAHARTYVNDPDIAEDLAQDLAATALASADTYRGSADLRAVRAWLIGILNHLCSHTRTRHQREQASMERLVDHLNAERGKLSRGTLYDATIWLLRVANLDARQTYVVRARIDGETLTAMAAHMQCDVRTVRATLQAAITQLRACPYNDLPTADLSQHDIRSGDRVTIYHRPQRTGSGLDRAKLARLK